MKIFANIVGMALALNISLGYSQNEILVDLSRIRPEQLKSAGFQLDFPQKIIIEAGGLRQESGSKKLVIGFPWILRSDSREVIWEFPATKYNDRRLKIQEEKVETELQAGTYEVYYSSFPYYRSAWVRGDGWHRERGFVGTFFEWLFGDDHYGDYSGIDRDIYDDFKIVIKGNGHPLDQEALQVHLDKIRGQSRLVLNADRDDLYLQKGFELKKPATLDIYCLGEARDEDQYDFGWIIDLSSRKRIWQLDYRDSDHAGGSDKNRVVKTQIDLQPGKYVAFFVTDDSHSPWEWNSAPAYDPYFWGLTIKLQNPELSFLTFDYYPYKKENVVVSLTRLRDDEYVSEGITLKRPMTLHVYALGEGRRREMYDYGWIIDAKTREIVWKMDYRDTEHAGGAKKNRVYDGTLDLSAGDYMVYFVTDGSHSYRHWNTNPPYDQTNWGITLSAQHENFQRSDIVPYRDEENPAIIARIARVRNHENIRESFTLSQDGTIRVYAIGEGVRGQMYDYGWIEDSGTGKVVWEMGYRMTDHAGGARKNRLYNDVIHLKRGEYRVFYQSDDSHAYNDWNDTPPHDPGNWGITLYRVN